MKEKELDRILDNLIIDGLIKEAEQDNAEFVAAMRNMSDEEFYDLLKTTNPYMMRNLFMPLSESKILFDTPQTAENNLVFSENRVCEMRDKVFDMDDELVTNECRIINFDEYDFTPPKKSPFKKFIPWLAALLMAAAVILIILIPSFNSMNAKLCDSALYMSEAYFPSPKEGLDVYSATVEQIKAELPSLKKRYDASIKSERGVTVYSDDFQEAGYALAIAYLKLHKKNDASKVLKSLESQAKGSPFAEHCSKILEQLE